MTDFAQLVLSAESTGLKSGEQALIRLASTAERTENRAGKAMTGLSKATEQVGKQSIFATQQLRMSAMQLSQVAQQASATGNVMQALAIQLPDLALGFGPIGIAAGAAAGAILSYFATYDQGEDASKVLRDQENLIRQVADRWGDAVPALRAYADELERASQAADLAEGLGILKERDLSEVRAAVDDVQVSIAALVRDLEMAGEETGSIIDLQDALNGFSESAQDGEVSASEVEKVTQALASAINGSGIPALAEFAASFSVLSNSALDAAQKVESAMFAAQMAQSRINDPSTWRSFGQRGQSADSTIQGGGFVLPDIGPTPDGRGTPELSGYPYEKIGGRGRGRKSGGGKSDASLYDDIIKAAERRIATLDSERDAVGLLEEEQDVLRNTTELYNEAQQKGLTLSDSQMERLENLSETMARVSEETRLAKEQLKFFDDIEDDLKEGLIDSIVEGKKLSDTFKDIGKSIAKAALEAAFFGSGPFAAGTGSGGGNFHGGIFTTNLRRSR
ncbi:hypothetical protein P6U16_01295 [Rhizobium sp. 32-5/1]|uniref:hypothetical protein n=1 Tax=Rhizobium sp. 32-5/1 TaxID=3019602 RepID=UPI00240E74CE|nr:hypothetical protein [Rhizobium sp. 32-5/1]WEZ83521.1 hypothetical protein P6U16_01295 [Rhizobium sp. 32-5/1]